MPHFPLRFLRTERNIWLLMIIRCVAYVLVASRAVRKRPAQTGKYNTAMTQHPWLIYVYTQRKVYTTILKYLLCFETWASRSIDFTFLIFFPTENTNGGRWILNFGESLCRQTDGHLVQSFRGRWKSVATTISKRRGYSDSEAGIRTAAANTTQAVGYPSTRLVSINWILWLNITNERYQRQMVPTVLGDDDKATTNGLPMSVYSSRDQSRLGSVARGIGYQEDAMASHQLQSVRSCWSASLATNQRASEQRRTREGFPV